MKPRSGKKSTDRKQYWAQHVTQWEESGLSKAEYGHRTGIHPVVLSRWVKKVAADKENELFIRVDPARITADFQRTIEVILANGITIRSDESISPGVLREFTEAIRSL